MAAPQLRCTTREACHVPSACEFVRSHSCRASLARRDPPQTRAYLDPNGADSALALCHSLDPQIVVMDITLPGMSGLEVLRLMLALKQGKRYLSAAGRRATGFQPCDNGRGCRRQALGAQMPMQLLRKASSFGFKFEH